MPNITGETGYQPVWAPDGTWRYDEFTGLLLTERKWALGFAAGVRSPAVGLGARSPLPHAAQRRFGQVMGAHDAAIGKFAERRRPSNRLHQTGYRHHLLSPCSSLSQTGSAIRGAADAVRAHYYYARGEAYAVGEYQIASLGSPKLIILPSSFALTETAWQAIVARVKAGAILLVTGRSLKTHTFTRREGRIRSGWAYVNAPLTLRSNLFKWPGGEEELTFAGNKTTILSRAQMYGDKDWAEQPRGKGRILFAALPIELNQNLQAVGDVYRYAMRGGEHLPTYTTTLAHPGTSTVLPACLKPTSMYQHPKRTRRRSLSTMNAAVRTSPAELENGRAAPLLISDEGKLITSYNWPAH